MITYQCNSIYAIDTAYMYAVYMYLCSRVDYDFAMSVTQVCESVKCCPLVFVLRYTLHLSLYSCVKSCQGAKDKIAIFLIC